MVPYGLYTMDYIRTVFQEITPWLLTHGVKIALIVFAAFIVNRSALIFIDRLVRKLMRSDRHLSEESRKKREDTLIKIFSATLTVVVWILAVLMVLQEVDIAIGPLLAAAGIVGLAFGFGGQYLIRDLISGLFIFVENQYRIGDVVCFDSTCGLVEDITLRMTTLRDLDGTVHHIPHGTIQKVSNLSKSFSRVNLNIGVSYQADLEHVIAVVNKVGADLALDEEWKDKIIKPPQFLRVDDFGESAVVIKILGETKPIEQWGVAGELRKRLKIAFDKEDIEIPFPQRVIHQSTGPKNDTDHT